MVRKIDTSVFWYLKGCSHLSHMGSRETFWESGTQYGESGKPMIIYNNASFLHCPNSSYIYYVTVLPYKHYLSFRASNVLKIQTNNHLDIKFIWLRYFMRIVHKRIFKNPKK